jgi:Na+-translocating ferredoxin:NAD+ oxidoreductase RnfG subunit
LDFVGDLVGLALTGILGQCRQSGIVFTRKGLLMKLRMEQGCLGITLIGGLVISIQNFQSNPIFFFLFLAVILTFVVSSIAINKANAKKRLVQFELQAALLDNLVASDFKVENTVLSPQKDEVLIYNLEGVSLVEYKSTGSTYSGGYAGLSFRVAKGVRLNAGKTGGSSTRNPETPQELDKGELTVTNQRVIFTGGNQVRVFDLDKVVNMEASPNGISVSISVSNRERTTELQSNNMDDLTPGMAVSLASAWHEGGKKHAIEVGEQLATQLRQLVSDERAK